MDQNETASDLATLAIARCGDERREARTAVEEFARSEHAMTVADQLFDQTEKSVRQVVATNVLEMRAKAKTQVKPPSKR
ncbi:hypothetical protein [Sphingomonas sp.]|uniref:hypothetical protein n=1 Tax=Sphingomonas sp. TaxID=28214 RepID=UPI00257D8DD8|nr:hypothetical protein [Sphingomonas sp.]